MPALPAPQGPVLVDRPQGLVPVLPRQLPRGPLRVDRRRRPLRQAANREVMAEQGEGVVRVEAAAGRRCRVLSSRSPCRNDERHTERSRACARLDVVASHAEVGSGKLDR
jgi:hypothetical protein